MDAASFLSALSAGALSFFSPCILPLLPVYVGILTSDMAEKDLGLWRKSANTLAFVLGISTVFVLLGFGAGAAGTIINNHVLGIVLGVIIFAFGLVVADVIHIRALENERRFDLSKIKGGNPASSFLLGLGFSFGWTPCVGPILGSILALAAEQGSAGAGALLLLVYSLGLCVPFVVITLASDVLLARLSKVQKYMPLVKRVGGILIAAMGVWMTFTQAQGLIAARKAEANAANIASVQGVSAGEVDASGVSSAWKNVTLTDLDGNKHRFSELKGKPVYFEFWGSWCTSCVEDMATMSEIYHNHAEAGDVEIVTIITPNTFGEKSADDFVTWAREQGVDFTVWMDENASLVQYLNVTGFPTSVIVDSDGNIERVRVGAVEKDELEQLISELS